MLRNLTLPLAMALMASPAFAATGPFFSLKNTDFIVLLGFIAFCAILLYFKVPGLIIGMLDKRAEGIQSELSEARALREEAQSLLASYERKQKDVEAQAERIITQAREEAASAAEQAKAELQRSIARRLAGAEEQIASAEAGAVRDVRNKAVAVAIAAAREVVAGQMNAEKANALIDASITEVDAKLH
ncbi:F0F1 ATP synthase subunit B [Poseidonocella sedimentorum]|uniref:ATP synthase subunit b n=1 Tax=Poseidonocella sedimentorum TaxID=871652 RepID=A0A1I6DQ80_9RHOB|nr:F0F1 ATP synthase subunit B [Poseidonocella sedimentorum]SFR07586.1 ATP synthase F0 subcomplex B subunit [Poseidonocella sedimentorum]